jgi:uncharacterized protein
MKKTLLIIIAVLVLAVTVFSLQTRINPLNIVKKPVRTDLKIPMNDGIPLSTTVFLPHGKKKFAAILVRTPYNKVGEEWLGRAFGLYGIAVVIQDTRGKYGSEGEYYPFINERADGLKTLRWIREQPWSNGIVAGWGGSYVGYTQWAISDSLDYIVPLLSGANLYDFLYPDGLFSLQSAFEWGFKNASPKLNTISADSMRAGYNFLPLFLADDTTIKDIPYINDWLAHEDYDSYWSSMDHRGIARSSVLSIAGWYDIFLKAQIRDFQALSGKGNQDNRMIIGPWCHGSQGEFNEYGGSKKTGGPKKIFTYMVQRIKGNGNSLPSPLKDTRYNLFIMERNEYFGTDVWPPRETKMIPYYLGPGGYFTRQPYTQTGQLPFTYDPADPFPSHGGTALGDKVGPARQNDNLSRSDQVVFETGSLSDPLVLLGPVSATLWVSSDAACTDFYVCIQDVFPDGKIINIQEGGSKVRLTTSKPEMKEISVWATGYQLNPGHKLRTTISSSWFPRFNRNLNNSLPIASANNPVLARQTIYFGPDMPSCINLPVIELKEK